jgi:hypothetical protein
MANGSNWWRCDPGRLLRCASPPPEIIPGIQALPIQVL